MPSNDIHNIFAGQKNPKPITQYMLSRGVVDFSNLNQFDNFELHFLNLIAYSCQQVDLMILLLNRLIFLRPPF